MGSSTLKIEGDLTKELRDSLGGTIRTYQTTTKHPFEEIKPTKPPASKPQYSVRLLRSNSIPLKAGHAINNHR